MTIPTKQKVQVVTIAENQLLLLQFAKYHGEGFQNITGSVEYDESFLEAARR
ncbi:MAG: NUDIX domain-containing protein, partial [Bacteriovorax sp.]